MYATKNYQVFIMKAEFSILLTIILLTLLVLTPANAQEETNYCYKPSKPLFLSTAKTKKRYAEDMQEYQRCKEYFIEMQQRSARIKQEADKSSQRIMSNYSKQ